jgi:hypothetical protein
VGRVLLGPGRGRREEHPVVPADRMGQLLLLLLSCRAVNDHVYMPAAADAGPASFMRWLKEHGGGGPPVTKLKDPFVGHSLPGMHA